MSNVVKNLQAARDLLAGEGAWFQGWYAGVDGQEDMELNANDPKANCWCALGALQKVGIPGDGDADPGLFESPEVQALVAAINSTGFVLPQESKVSLPVAYYNDAEGRTQEEILAVFDKAIAVETLKAARALIAHERSWAKGGCVLVNSDSPDGRCFCAIGAVGYAVAGDAWIDVREDYIDWEGAVFDPYDREETPALSFLDGAAVIVSNGEWPFAYSYNDRPERTHGEVLALFDKAIELASAS